MTDIQVFILAMVVFTIIVLAYYKGWDDGFELGKQRGWSSGYSSAKATDRVVLDEVFDYEKN
jgi:hypothetical protein